MADLVVIVPSRGRPQNIDRLITAWEYTGAFHVAELVICLDDDDPQLPEYERVIGTRSSYAVGRRMTIVGWLNNRAAFVPLPCVGVGFMGDDHVPRTIGWAQRVLQEIRSGAGVVYGDDRLQGEKLATAAFLDARIVTTLGVMAPPALEHLYVDNYWMELGRAIGRLRYLPDVVIEHMHPFAGKAQHDQTYAEANAPERDRRDKATFDAWMSGGGRYDAVKRLAEAGLAGWAAMFDMDALREAGLC